MEKTIQCAEGTFVLSGSGVARAELRGIPTKEENVSIVRLSLGWDGETLPEPFSVSWQSEITDVYSVWTPRGMATPVSWSGVHVNSRLASDSPVLSLISKSGQNRCTMALSDPKTPIRMECKAVLDGFLRLTAVTLFTEKTGPFSAYEVDIRIDRSPLPFSEAIRNTRAWYDSIGYRSLIAPDAAFEPVYSTWYSYLQKVTQADVIAECRIAAKLGMKTVIVDDGWQKGDHPSVYGFTGDWQPCAEKFPDMGAMVDEIHALGMKVVLWFAVPFIGEYAQNYTRFADRYLNYVRGCDCSVLDPRYPEVRRFVCDTYVDALRKWHPDGFKLDFIDRFKTNGEILRGMDHVSVEEATDDLLVEVMTTLTALKPDILLEFRQPYAGIAPQRFGNMFRVWDCPNDGFTNRMQTINLRLLNGKGAVHSDMIDASENETVESFSAQLIGTLFSVPQISFRLASLSPAHSKALSRYLAFWTAHRDTLMHGRFSAQSPELAFAYTEAESEAEKIAVNLSGQTVISLPGKTTYCFNLSSGTFLPVALPVPASVTASDCLGNVISGQNLPAGVHLINVPLCGSVVISPSIGESAGTSAING